MTDGDTIGYLIVKKDETIGNDDFQTEDDKRMRKALEVTMDKQGKRFSKEASFKLNVDF